MANIIKPKRSNTAAKVPTTTELISGELGVNMADRKVYINNGTAVVQVGAGNLSGLGDVTVTSPTNGQSLKYNSTTTKWENSTAGAGDVVGPASATDNALVRFDGTTGKLIQNSTATLDDTGNMDTASVKADYFDLDTAAAAPADAVGRTAWDDGSGGSILGLKGGVVTYYTGQQEFARVYNGSGTAMTKGQVVYIVGAQGNRVDVRLAQANAESTSANTIGFVAEPIAAGAEGWVQTTGPLPKLNTSTLTAGQTVYLSPTTPGAYTTTKPTAPNHLVILGFVERVSATVGSIFLKIDNGYELDELHNVNISSPTGGQLLAYDQTNGYWKNLTLTDGTGISVTEAAGGAITVTNTAPDQTVVLTQGGATTITGTYPNFTISSVNTTYGAATSTVPGLIELGSDTAQTVAANAVSATASRSYALQVNAAGQGVVNVPWTDTNSGGTVTSVALSGGTTGLTTSGGPITTSGTITLAGTLAVANGGTGATTAAAARTNLGATTLGGNLYTLANVAAIAFPRFNADNTVSSLDAASFRTAIGAGTSSTTGTVTSVDGTGTVSGLTLTGTVTSSGNLTLGGTLAVTPSNFASQTANTFLAAPNGAAGVPTFRAMVAADVPTLNQNTTGNAATATTATNATNVTATTSGTASAFKVPFLNTTANTTGNYGLLHDSQSTFTYNASTNTLNVDVVEAAIRFSTGGASNGRYFANNNSNVQILDFGVGTGTGVATDIGLFNLASGSIVFGTSSNDRGRIQSNGYFVLGSTFASYNYNGNSLSWVSNAGGLVLSNASTGDANQIVFNNPNGQVGYVNTAGTSTIYASASDYRLKKDVKPMVGALQKIAMLKPCTYKWKIDDTDGQGFIAHELQEVIPSCVAGEKDAVRDDGTPKYQGVDASFLVATLTAAIQEQQAIIQDMKARIEALEATKI